VETIASVCGRIDRLLASLAAQHRGRTVILVSHGDVLQILLARAAGLDPHRHRELAHLGNAECRRVPGALP
jgi:probable phosphoglycerate mutase